MLNTIAHVETHVSTQLTVLYFCATNQRARNSGTHTQR